MHARLQQQVTLLEEESAQLAQVEEKLRLVNKQLKENDCTLFCVQVILLSIDGEVEALAPALKNAISDAKELHAVLEHMQTRVQGTAFESVGKEAKSLGGFNHPSS